jgi:hypothetical protein
MKNARQNAAFGIDAAHGRAAGPDTAAVSAFDSGISVAIVGQTLGKVIEQKL